MRCVAIVLALCIFLPGCTEPVGETDIFHGEDLPTDDPEYDISELSLIKPDGNVTNLSD